MTRRIHRIILLIALLVGGAGMSYVEAAKVTLTVQASPSSYGQVRIGTNAWSSSTQQQTATGAKPTISAQANSGYRFTKWNDNNTNASRQITIGNSNVTYTAYFEPNTVTLTVTSNNTNYGTVTGGGTYSYGTSVTIKATPKTGYHFVQWSDGNKNASRTVTATANATYTATFAINQYTIKFVNNGTTLQTLTVNHGVKPSYTGSTPTKTATAQYTYTFSGWSPTIVAATADATYTAQFSSTVRSYTIRFLNGSSVLQTGSVKYGTTPSYTGATPTKAQTAQYIYTFSGWSPAIASVTKAQDYTAQFSSTVRSYKITGKSADNAMGTVSGGGTYNYGTSVTLTATPESCADFVQWNDGNTDNPRTVTVTGTKTYTATFAAKTYNGTCGTNLQWSLNRCTGVLSITGSGAMTNYPQPTSWVSGGDYHAPWWSHRSIITSVTIANTVTSIGVNAFDECENITSVSMGSGIKTIGLGAFFECSSLTSITIPNGVTTINAQTFEYCSSLTSVTIPNSVTSIEGSAFNGCTSLSSITIPNSVTSIGTYAFKGCSSLSSITIPNSVTAIGGEAFSASSQKLKDIYVSWTSADAIPAWSNMTYGTRANITLHVPCGYGDIYRATTYWQDYTMQGSGTSNYTLTVKTNDSSLGTVQIDGETAGTNVSKSVHCEDTHTIRATRNTSTCCVFKRWSDGNRDNPRRIGIDENTTFTAEFVEGLTSGKCGPDAWYVLSCDSVMTISGTGAIRSMAFDGNSRIKSVVIEEGITAIEGRAFSYCSNMVHITFPNTMTDIGGSSGHVFYCCYKLKSIYIPASVTNIGRFPLLRCNDLEIIQVDPANTVYDSRNNCNAIIETSTNKMIAGCMHTVMPHTTEIIDQFCFEYLHKLKSMLIASSVHTFNGQTFKECENLKDIYVEWTENIPAWSSLTNWSEHYSDNLDPGITLHVPCGKKAMYEAATGWNKYNIVDDHLKGGMCGMYGSNQTWMLSCDSVLTIRGSGAMENFVYSGGTSTAEWFDYRETVKTVILTDEITSIGENAFVGFTNLTDIYAPWTDNIPVLPASNTPQSSVKLHIACSAVSAYQAAGWGNYTVEAEYTASGTCGADGDNLTWTLCDGVLTISGTGEMADWFNNTANIPWYSYRESITSLVIEDGVTTIGRYAFYNCTNLTSVTVPPSITLSGNEAFCNCYAIESLYITDLAAWCSIYFDGSESNPFNIDDLFGTPSPEERTLYVNGTKVTTLTFPDGVTSIGDRAFIGVTSITDIQFNQVTTIGQHAFARCNGLTDVTIPDGVIDIRFSAFHDCTQLRSMSIPATLSSNSGWAMMYNCQALTDFYVHWTENIPTWLNITSKSPQSSITLHVPCGTEELYNAANGWNGYTIEADGGQFTVTVQAEDPTMGMVQLGTAAEQASFTEQFNCGEEITITAIPANGYAFDQWSDNSTQASRTITLTSDTTLTALFKQSVYPEHGALPGVFSVSDTKKVVFSQGNLQFNAALGTHQRTNGTTANGTWRFAENQYDFVGDNTQGNVYFNDEKCSNERVSNSYNGWIDYFNHGNTGYSDKSPTSYTTAFGMNFNSPSVYDWGSYVAISNGGNMPGYYIVNGWIVLQRFQWNYLFNSRANAQDLRSLATVNDVLGCILLPDDWQLPSGIVFTPDASSYATNTYTGEQWNRMEQAGAVFLPAAGRRAYDSNGSPQLSYPEIQTTGYVWSSSGIGNQGVAVAMSFGIDNFALKTFVQGGANKKYDGISVRLVHYVSSYHIIFRGYKDGEENVVLQDKLVAEGAMPIPPEVPEDDCRTFIGWDRVIEPASGDTEYIAQYELKGPYTITVQAEDPEMGDVSIVVN